MFEMIGILVGTMFLAALKPTPSQTRRFEGWSRPHASRNR